MPRNGAVSETEGLGLVALATRRPLKNRVTGFSLSLLSGRTAMPPDSGVRLKPTSSSDEAARRPPRPAFR